MKIIYRDEIIHRMGGAGAWPSGARGLARMLGMAMLIVVLHNAIHAYGQALPGSSSVPLAWDPSPSSEVVGYRVYQGATSGNYSESLAVGNVTTYSVPGLLSGVSYFFAVTAYDASGLESEFSNEIHYSTPGEPPPVQISLGTNGEVRLTITGRIGHGYEILATQRFMAWEVIGSVTLGSSGSTEFTDTNAAAFPERFYRTVDEQPDISDPVINLPWLGQPQ